MANSDKMLLKRIEDLERFLKSIILKPEFWTEHLFDFLNIPKNEQMILFDIKNKNLLHHNL